MLLAARLKKLPSTFYGVAGVLALSLALPLPSGGSIAGLPSVCPFFNLTGLPCPGCGLTRSFVCFAHGHVLESLRWHPLGPLLFSSALLYLAGTLFKWKWPSEKVLVGAFAVLMLAFWGLRLHGTFPIPAG